MAYPLPEFGGQLMAKQNMAIQPATLAENIDTQIGQAETRLQQLKELKDLLARNPDFEKMLSLLGNGLLRY